jgi:glycosyltransferase involved in cell wall biosynthesis
MVESGAIRADLGIPVGHFLIVTPARLAPQKGLELLVAAAARLADRPLTWLVAGEGPLRPRLEAAINQDHLPVRLIGHRSDLIELFRSADLVVSPSLSEGQPVALQEAVLVGAAVLATAVGGTAETLGDGGQLVAPTAEAVADGIAQLMDHPEQLEALRRRARARAAELPTALDMAAQLKRIYAR